MEYEKIANLLDNRASNQPLNLEQKIRLRAYYW